MTDKDKIKEEIKRLYNLYELANDYQRMGACSTILDFIDSLPEEPSVKGITWEDVNTLNTLINQVRYEFPNGIGEKSFGLAVLEKFQDYQDDIEEPASEDLEEEIKRFFTENNWFIIPIADIARHFAEWQKQQMMKDAIECVVEDWCGNSPEITIPLL